MNKAQEWYVTILSGVVFYILITIIMAIFFPVKLVKLVVIIMLFFPVLSFLIGGLVMILISLYNEVGEDYEQDQYLNKTIELKVREP